MQADSMRIPLLDSKAALFCIVPKTRKTRLRKLRNREDDWSTSSYGTFQSQAARDARVEIRTYLTSRYRNKLCMVLYQ